MRSICLRSAALAAVLACAAAASPAAELYTGVGVPGIGLGVAHPVSPVLTLRADAYSLGERDRRETEDGIQYDGKYRLHRAAFVADWFPFGGSFRFTGGATVNTYRATLDASGAGGAITIGDRTYATTAADGLTVQIEFPKTTPYLGIGWGHHAGKGWRFSADVGASIGKAKLSATPRGQLAQQPDIQANIDKELAELRDGVGKVRAVPQISIGFGYSF